MKSMSMFYLVILAVDLENMSLLTPMTAEMLGKLNLGKTRQSYLVDIHFSTIFQRCGSSSRFEEDGRISRELFRLFHL